jgi:glyceraldehyde-3-phosphate dehydrogenase/erythrose-4-phosphate dehydrogenase
VTVANANCHQVYALKYDFAHTHVNFHKRPMDVRETPTGQLVVNNSIIHVYTEIDAEKIPWQLCGVNYVVETATNLSKTAEAKKHLRKKGEKPLQKRANEDDGRGCINALQSEIDTFI